MLRWGYIFQKSDHIFATAAASAQLIGNLPVYDSVAAHDVHCVVESVGCPMDPCAGAES